jgi:hypothetical protein
MNLIIVINSFKYIFVSYFNVILSKIIILFMMNNIFSLRYFSTIVELFNQSALLFIILSF